MALARPCVRPVEGILAAVAIFIAPFGLWAQDEPPKVEVFAGYSYLTDTGEDAVHLPLGFSTSLAWNPSRRLGLVLDLDAHFNQRGGSIEVTEYGYLGGARYSWRGTRVTPYVELLAGAVRTSSTVRGVSLVGQPFTVSIDPATDFAAQAGVGLDLRLSERMAFRASADYRNIRRDGESFQQFRSSVGLTFGFGGGSGSRIEPAPRTPPAATFTPVEASPPAPRRELPPEDPAPPQSAAQPQPRAPRVVVITPETPPRPAPAAPAASVAPAPTDPLGVGRARLKGGDLSGAALAFREHLTRARSRYTIAIGLFCDLANVASVTQQTGGDDNLLVLSVSRGGQSCYGVYWGLYESHAAAQQAIAALPEGLRAGGPAVVAVSRLLR